MSIKKPFVIESGELQQLQSDNILDANSVQVPGRQLVLQSPYTNRLNVYKGQLHCHSTGSDGADTPTVVVTAYKNAGYDFISLTDHNVITADPAVAGILFIAGLEQEPTQCHTGRIRATNTTGTGAALAQTVIDAAIVGGEFVQINHPNWSSLPLAINTMYPWLKYHAVEVYNALVAPNQNAENRIDSLLSSGRRFHLTAGDDCHNITSSFNLAWVNVFADSLTEANIVDSLKYGNFYSSTGATISSVSVVGNVITVVTDAASTIAFIGNAASSLQSSAGATSASYTVVGHEVYIRVKITKDSDGTFAWTNPIYVDTNWRNDSFSTTVLQCGTALYSSGRLGIGKIASSAVLEVDGSIDSGYAKIKVTGAAAADLYLNHSAAAANGQWLMIRSQSGKGHFSSMVDTGENYYREGIMTLNLLTGCVGINQLTPTYPLHISATETLNSGYSQVLASGTSAADFFLRHTGAAVNAKMTGLRSQNGYGEISSYVDGGAYQQQGIIKWNNLTGAVGILVADPTARLHLPAGSATAGTAPLKFTSGPVTTSAVAGQLEYSSGSFFIRGTDILDVASKVATPEIKTNTTTPTDLTITTGAAKTLVLATPVYDDLQFPIANGKVPSSNAPNWETFTTNTSEYAFDIDEYIDLQANECPHWWVEGTNGDLHVHFTIKAAQNSGANQYVKFSAWVAYAEVNKQWVEQSVLTYEATIATGSGALKCFYLDMGDVTLTNYLIGTQIKVRIKRIAATTGTEYASSVFVTQVGMHLQKNRLGSRTEITS